MADAHQPTQESDPEPFKSIEQSQPKNLGSQILIVAVLIVTILGAFLVMGGLLFGLVLLVGGLVALIALTVWAIRNWRSAQ